MRYCAKCGSQLSDGTLFCTNCGHRLIESQLKPKEKPKKAIMAVALVLVVAIVAGILWGKPIITQISNMIDPGVTAKFEVQIPDGETELQKTENMNRISYMTKIRLIYLGCSKAKVSVDNNVVTIKNIPRDADFSKVTDYITSHSYTAEIQDASGETIIDNCEFSYALALPGIESDIQYDISIGLTTDGDKALNEAIKSFADQDEEQNDIVLIANGIRIATLHINAEEVNNGITSTMLDFVVPTENKIDFTLEELTKALNSCGKLPYALSLIEEILSGTSQIPGNSSKSSSSVDLHPDELIGTYALVDATRNPGVSAFYSAVYTDYTVAVYKDGTYSIQGTIFRWDGTSEGKKYGTSEEYSEQGKWVFYYAGGTYNGITYTPSDDLKGTIQMGENNFLKSVGDDPVFYGFHFYITKDNNAYDAYSTQGNYSKYYKKAP